MLFYLFLLIILIALLIRNLKTPDMSSEHIIETTWIAVVKTPRHLR